MSVKYVYAVISDLLINALVNPSPKNFDSKEEAIAAIPKNARPANSQYVVIKKTVNDRTNVLEAATIVYIHEE